MAVYDENGKVISGNGVIVQCDVALFEREGKENVYFVDVHRDVLDLNEIKILHKALGTFISLVEQEEKS